ncbi:MAG: hypothetical protein AB2651_22070 [Candidatus Thiodiazotropha sp.]
MVDGRTLVPDLSESIRLALGLGKQIRQNQINEQTGKLTSQAMEAPADERAKLLGEIAQLGGIDSMQEAMQVIQSGDQMLIAEMQLKGKKLKEFGTFLYGIQDRRERTTQIKKEVDRLIQNQAPESEVQEILALANMDFHEQNMMALKWMKVGKNADELARLHLIPEKQKSTTLMQNLEASGLEPGTPEYQQAMKQAVMKPQSTQTINVGGEASKSLSKQIGPLLKESKTKASGAIAMFRNAVDIENAISKGDVIAGPGATLRLKAEQVASLFGFKGDGAIERTRQVIRGLTSTAVEARKELAGQGQVTENEAAAVEKAMSGNIDDLTVEELQLIANLNKKHALYLAQQHQDYLDAIPESDANLRPFFQIRGLDEVLQYDPNSALGLPVQDPGNTPPQVEDTRVDNGKTYIKIQGKWYEQ